MKRLFAITFALFFALALTGFAQPQRQMTPEQQAAFQAQQEATRKDHRQMMEQLKITTLRPGANPNDPKAPNAVNYDEAKANPWPNLPDPLVLKNGKKVTSAKVWWNQRRAEIIEDFDREVYGRVPKNVPKVKWEVVSTTNETKFDVPVIVKQIVGHVDNSAYPEITVDIQLTLTTPANARGPVPVMLEFGFNFPRPPANAGNAANANRPAFPEPTWQKLLFEKGWGFATIVPTSYQPDNGAGLTKGIIGLVNKGQNRKPEDWGALRAWAWGASRALDYFETDKSVNAKQVGIEGLSRYGKAALVTMAYDQRFAIGFIGSSGEGGAKLHRRTFGELVENLTGSGGYHWMAGNFLKYGGPLTANDLPVDAHEMIALCAPRPTFVSYGAAEGQGAEGKWVDQRGSFMAAVAAGPVFRLLGKKDLGTTEFPAVETALVDGDLAWRQHAGGHTVVPNWPTFLTWASRYIKGPAISQALSPTDPKMFHLETKDAPNNFKANINDLEWLVGNWKTETNAMVFREDTYLPLEGKQITGVNRAIAHNQVAYMNHIVIWQDGDVVKMAHKNFGANLALRGERDFVLLNRDGDYFYFTGLTLHKVNHNLYEAYYDFGDRKQLQLTRRSFLPNQLLDVLELATEKELYPEGLAVDVTEGKIFLNSTNQNKIVSADFKGEQVVDIQTPYRGKMRGTGLLLEANRLYALGNDNYGSTPNARHTSVLQVIDSKTGKLMRSYEKDSNARSLFNDITLAKNGTAYVTNTSENTIYAIDTLSAKSKFSVLAKSDDLTGPNGIAISAANDKLFIATDNGIRIYDLRQRRILPFTDASTAGIDGLKYQRGKLYGLQKGQLVAFHLSENEETIVQATVLVKNSYTFESPTSLSIIGDVVYVLANSQFGKRARIENNSVDKSQLTNTYILKYKI